MGNHNRNRAVDWAVDWAVEDAVHRAANEDPPHPTLQDFLREAR